MMNDDVTAAVYLERETSRWAIPVLGERWILQLGFMFESRCFTISRFSNLGKRHGDKTSQSEPKQGTNESTVSLAFWYGERS
jgi:hypothetical protein